MSEQIEELYEAITYYKTQTKKDHIPDEAIWEVLSEDEFLVDHIYPIIDLTKQYDKESFPPIFTSLVIGVYEGILMMAQQHVQEHDLWENKLERKMGIDKKGNIFIS